jgi:hypothetical protein
MEALKAADEGREPNDPERLPGRGTSGRRDYLTPTERRTRRETLSLLMANGASMDVIIEAMGRPPGLPGQPGGHGMHELETRKLLAEVRSSWQEEDAESARHYKSAAIRRLHRHIAAAKLKNAWTAIAMFEKILAQVQGTLEPIQVSITAEARVAQAVLHVLGESDPEQIRRLVDEEIARFPSSGAAREVLQLMAEQERDPVTP